MLLIKEAISIKLDNKTKELIAIGASITANCQPCLEYHTKKAIEYGANNQEISEAIEMGRAVRKGAAAKMDRLISKIDASKPHTKSNSAQGCECTN